MGLFIGEISEAMPPTVTEKPAVDVDNLIVDLIETAVNSGAKGYKTSARIADETISYVCETAKKLIMAQPCLLELSCPMKVVGDIHGQFSDLIRLFQIGGYPPDTNYLFLGDYVDRGRMGLETTLLLLCYKIKYPENFFLLRGNHECSAINRIYGFYDECRSRASIKSWKIFNELFDCLPYAAIISDKIFCIHGGLSPDMLQVDQINAIERPSEVPDCGMVCDFLWSDPDVVTSGWGENERGVSYTFGGDVVRQFCQEFDFDLVVRAHQVVENGYEFLDGSRRLVTVFSAPNYCGEFNNAGALMIVNENLMCSFQVLKPSVRIEDKIALKSPAAKTGRLTSAF